MELSKAVVYNAYGPPAEVLHLEQRSVGQPGPGEVRLRMLAAPIHPSDLGMILGKYGSLADLPAVAGREGLAEVEAIGDSVTDYKPGDRVIIPAGTGSWQSHAIVAAEKLSVVPAGIPVEMAAMCVVNAPTAWRLLRDYGLSSGDWVAQNAANSAVGLHVIEMARHLGIKTLNVVRRPELIEPLKEKGADVVVLEDSGYERKLDELTGGEKVRVALNSIGGESAIRLVNILAEEGVHITFGAMQFEPVRYPTRALIFNNVTMGGFWMDRWFKSQSEARVKVMYDKIFDLMEKGIVTASVDSMFAIEDFAKAIERAQQPRLGKVLFKFN